MPLVVVPSYITVFNHQITIYMLQVALAIVQVARFPVIHQQTLSSKLSLINPWSFHVVRL